MQIVAALVWPALALVFAGVFTGLWWAERVRVHLLGFAAGFFCLFLAMAIHIAVPSANSVMAIPLLHSLACLSVIAIIWSAAKRLGQKIPLAATLTISAISCAGLYFALNSSNQPMALVIQNGTSGLLFAIGAIVLWTARSVDLLDRMLVGTLTLLAGFSLVRPVVVLLLQIELSPLQTQELEVQAVNVVIMTLLTVMLGGVLIAIAIREAIEIRHKAARIDPVSGFLDQRTFERKCGLALVNAHRLGMPVSLAVLECDRFDMLQQKWGKATIDRVIREICDVVRSWQRDSDIIGRVGEHRFAVFFIGVGASSAQTIVQNLRGDIDRALNGFVGDDLRFTLTASIAQKGSSTDLSALLRLAMQPLEQKRGLGPNLTFVNGEQTRSAPLGSRAEETFMTLN